MSTRTFYLGWTAEGYRITAVVRLEPAKPDVTTTFTDHATGPRPAELGIMFAVEDRRRANGYYQGGQVDAEHRIIARRDPFGDASREVAAFINETWSAHHLNTMHAACDHMTPEMLARRDGESTPDWQTRMLAEVVCPETGYRWGRAWLARPIPADVLDKLERLIATGAID